MKTNTPEKYFITQLYAHQCQLPPSDDYQHLESLSKAKNWFLISERNLESYLKAQSLSRIYYEKRRQVRTTSIVIHPYSKFRKLWIIWMSFVLLVALIMLPFFSAFHGPLYAKQLFYLREPFTSFWFVLYFVLIIQIACLVDIVINFFTGYVTREEMVIQPWRIMRDYLFTYFPFDLASSIPLDFILIMVLGLKKYSSLSQIQVMACAFIPFFKFARLYTLHKYWYVVFSTFSSSEAAYSVFCVTSLFFLFTHWSACITILFSQYLYYDHLFDESVEHLDSWIFEMRMLNRSMFSTYVCSWYRSVSCITGLGFQLQSMNKIEDKIISVFLGIIGSVYILVLLVVFLQATTSIARARMSYIEIMNQVNEYMEFKRFPKKLRIKVREYYWCLYQKRCIDEKAVLKLASDSLRKEILLRLYQRLIEKVNIFKGLSQNSTIKILSKLRPEIYREGEIAFSIGDFPDCMYFVSFGTFAFYRHDGVEIGHMDDGSYFGDLSLLFNVVRQATAVALETSLVYRFDSADFEEIIKLEKSLISKLEKNAEAWIRKVQRNQRFVEKGSDMRGKAKRNTGEKAEDDIDDDD